MSNALFENVYNPDVLSCLANLSNDEVFTPPDVVNKMLDMLPQELFRNPDTTFLDPACKTGVFLREIAKRLIVGLEPQIPDLQERVDHIFQKQLYGIAITELTSLLSRRGVYCSKYPNSEFSVSRFDDAQGNIRYKRIPHTWGKTTYDSNGTPKASCIWCGASKNEYDRSSELETHAYEWIHTQNPEEIFKMKFDVIIGNPPYQLSDGGGNGASAKPINQLFVTNAMKLHPRFIAMITPSRWFTGGKGLDEYRDKMLHDRHLRVIHDYPEADDCFSGVQIKGGVSFFLWDRDNEGDCSVYSHKGIAVSEPSVRPLLEKGCETFIRYNEAITILRKVMNRGESSFEEIVSSRLPFGIPNTFKGTKERLHDDDLILYVSGNDRDLRGTIAFISKSQITRGVEMIPWHKVYIAKAGSGSDTFPHPILPVPFYGAPGTVCNESYLVIGEFQSKKICKNVISYISTKFFRFLVLLKKNSQNAARGVYQFVPLQDFSKPWTDAELYTKYNLTQEEIDFIESMIKPMDSTNIKED